jgi:hypothetical protein
VRKIWLRYQKGHSQVLAVLLDIFYFMALIDDFKKRQPQKERVAIIQYTLQVL